MSKVTAGGSAAQWQQFDRAVADNSANTISFTPTSNEHFALSFHGDSKVVDKTKYINHLGFLLGASSEGTIETKQQLAGSMTFSKSGDGLTSLSLKQELITPRLVELETRPYLNGRSFTSYRPDGVNRRVAAELTLDDVATQTRKGNVINVEFLPGRMLKSMSVNTSTGEVAYHESKTGLGKLTSHKHAEGYVVKTGGSDFEIE